MMSYTTENALVDDVCVILEGPASPWEGVRLTREFDFRGGRTDIIAVDPFHNIIAFEAKLSRWRTALYQAYRYTSFAHYSYIVVPENTAKLAIEAASEFRRRSIGLCVALPGELRVLIQAPRVDPIQPWLSIAAIAKVTLPDSVVL